MKDEGIFHQALPALAAEPLHFPDSDGRFLPANHLQADAILSLRRGLANHFLRVPNVVVGGSMFMYYDSRDPAKRIEPHIFVVRDHDLGGREPYKFWVERRAPDFALDVIAPESGFSDWENEKKLYADLGIKEYFLFQPSTEREEPRLAGYRLWGQEYIELSHNPSAGPDGALRSETLGVSLRPDGERVRLRNLATDEDYAWSSENFVLLAVNKRRVAAAEERARRARQERLAADERARRARQERLAADERARRARQERLAADERARRARQEQRAAEARARRVRQERLAADERARRARQEQRAAEARAVAEEERTAAILARVAKMEAILVAAGVEVPKER